MVFRAMACAMTGAADSVGERQMTIFYSFPAVVVHDGSGARAVEKNGRALAENPLFWRDDA
ncbi:hypothetical protein D3877_08865 [Azospirillum cavernae]|uniref:Uncharacterized protein n=1 Tax=Azospirillum cavernae TaxID=2320860 RepID=A0A418W3Q3_9PROT|nr:hypothetical protein D3877_08865 [Azospirillum cavernae]